MWVAGIMQGLMWRAYDQFGFLQYSFAESVNAVHPFYVIRLLGGVCFLSGALIMVYNLIQTVRGPATEPRGGPRCRRLRGGRIRRCSSVTKPSRSNAFLFLVLTVLVIAIGGLVEVIPLFTIETTVEHVTGRAALLAAGSARPRHLCARRLLSLPQPDDPRAAR